MALQQSERYGTPLGQTLRVMAQENRDMRMSEAEKKAAALPPKLTVPMILFFLPVLFIVILGPGGDPGDGDPVDGGSSRLMRPACLQSLSTSGHPAPRGIGTGFIGRSASQDPA